MNSCYFMIMAMMTGTLVAARAVEDVAIGAMAPGFTLTDTQGRTNTLAIAKGKFVVLEWINPDCPFVRKHYDSGNMQKLQRQYTAKGVIWYSVCSSAAGKQGHYPADQWQALTREKSAAPTAVLLDADGQVGHLYGAKTTPHIFVIDPEGKLIYRGAIDDKASTKQEDIPTARNYLAEALDAAMAGKPVTTPATQSYGCSVKY